MRPEVGVAESKSTITFRLAADCTSEKAFARTPN